MSSDSCVSLPSSNRADVLEPGCLLSFPAETRFSFDRQNGEALAVSSGSGKIISEASPWVDSVLRRTLECAASALGLFFLLPIIAAVALCVRLESDGPIIFRQRRMGRRGCEFTLYKFRSMWIGQGGPSVTAAGDTRITRFGAFLRRYKLDELPQLWNVVRGDMSLVGPRPKLSHLEPLHMNYRPGITGAATLAFRSEEELLCGVPEDQAEAFYEAFVKPAKARIDLEYMQTASLRSDLVILWRTFVGGRKCRIKSVAGVQDLIRGVVNLEGLTGAVWDFPAQEEIPNSQIFADSEMI